MGFLPVVSVIAPWGNDSFLFPYEDLFKTRESWKCPQLLPARAEASDRKRRSYGKRGADAVPDLKTPFP